MDVTIVDAETGEVSQRDFTPEERAEYEAMLAADAAREAQRVAEYEAKEAARLSARERLTSMGFTDAEIDAMYPALSVVTVS